MFRFAELERPGCFSPKAIGPRWLHSASGTQLLPGLRSRTVYLELAGNCRHDVFFAKYWKTRAHISRSSRFLVACTVAILELTLLPTLQVLLLRNLLRGSLVPPFATSPAQNSSDLQKKWVQHQFQAEALRDSDISGNTDCAVTDADCGQASHYRLWELT